MMGNRIITMNIRRKIALQMVLMSLIPLFLIASFAYISMGQVQASTSESIADSRAEMKHNVVAVNLQNQALS
ncbi:MAG: hypothetical protein SVM79_09685, partial [Chloroflexota bacterium]|nr:hypothetical protein [Chloroflexota bacterium]